MSAQEVTNVSAGELSVDLPSVQDGKVLVVDDEEQVAELHKYRIDRKYEAVAATGGEEALETIDNDVDVVLLDRRMPEMTGGEVLAEIRSREFDCQVVMVTAVDPDESIASMDFDDYITKPVGDNELIGVVEDQLRIQKLNSVNERIQQVQAKIDILEGEYSTSSLENMDAYTHLTNLKTELTKLKDTIEGELHSY